MFLYTTKQRRRPCQFTPRGSKSNEERFPTNLLQTKTTTRRTYREDDRSISTNIYTNPRTRKPTTNTTTIIHESTQPSRHTNGSPTRGQRQLTNQPSRIPTIPLLSGTMPHNTISRGLSRRSQFLGGRVSGAPGGNCVLYVGTVGGDIRHERLSERPKRIGTNGYTKVHYHF